MQGIEGKNAIINIQIEIDHMNEMRTGTFKEWEVPHLQMGKNDKGIKIRENLQKLSISVMYSSNMWIIGVVEREHRNRGEDITKVLTIYFPRMMLAWWARITCCVWGLTLSEVLLSVVLQIREKGGHDHWKTESCTKWKCSHNTVCGQAVIIWSSERKLCLWISLIRVKRLHRERQRTVDVRVSVCTEEKRLKLHFTDEVKR